MSSKERKSEKRSSLQGRIGWNRNRSLSFQRSKKVTLVEMLEEIALDAGPLNRAVQEELKETEIE
jgi:hypothetical protein